MAMASSQWEEKDEFYALGHNYIHQHFDEQTFNAEDKLEEIAKERKCSLQSLQKMADTYIIDQNPGTLLAKSFSGEICQPDNQRTQGYVLVGLAQAMRKKADLSVGESPLNLFTAGAENQKIYGSYMHRGINHLLAAVTGHTPFTIMTMNNGEMEPLFQSDQEKSENQDTSELLNYLVQLSYQYGNGNPISEWENLGAALYVQLLQGKLSKDQYENLISQEINGAYTTMLQTLSQTSFIKEGSVDSFFEDYISDYIFKVVKGSLYPSKDVRSVENAVQEILDAKSKMANLTIQLVRKAFPQAVESQEIYAHAKELLAEKWIYRVLNDAFEEIDGERVPVIKDPYNNIWSELVLGYKDASDKIQAYRNKYHPNI